VFCTRLWLRPLALRDAKVVAEYRSDPAVARYQSWSTPFTEQDAELLIRESVTPDRRTPGWTQFAVQLISGRALIGDLGVNVQQNLMQADIGFTIAAGYQRQGYGSEAVRRMLEHLFTEQGLHRVSAECDARNLGSAALLNRVGFRREGCRRAHTWLKGEWTDDLVFGLLASDWAGAAGGRRHRRSFTV
jgi:RimJ/RimL family protein N-acetyltransferase